MVAPSKALGAEMRNKLTETKNFTNVTHWQYTLCVSCRLPPRPSPRRPLHSQAGRHTRHRAVPPRVGTPAVATNARRHRGAHPAVGGRHPVVPTRGGTAR